MIRRDESMRSFHLEKPKKTKRPVGRPKKAQSFKLDNSLKSFTCYQSK